MTVTERRERRAARRVELDPEAQPAGRHREAPARQLLPQGRDERVAARAGGGARAGEDRLGARVWRHDATPGSAVRGSWALWTEPGADGAGGARLGAVGRVQ